MPQMSPMNWLMLFTFFSTLLIIYNIMNYYSPYNKFTYKMTSKLPSKYIFWKW
uniref:ATP synthase F0 subunit 8 n=1 Tax=Parasphendale agrionina TaxID=766989 RepID=A0A977KC94_9NEOP|nr:ATP synthase F0 subunit 8 [Parasphendale agrionina]UXD78616.1 ATP synthase F0 subunit 8 [Parasphendale agrionina]